MFMEMATEKFPAIESQVPSTSSIVSFSEVYAMATDPHTSKPTPPTSTEIKSMTREQVTTKMTELSHYLTEVKSVVIYEMITRIISSFVEEVKKVHTSFKVEVPTFPSYYSISDGASSCQEIMSSISEIKSKTEVTTQIEVIKKMIFSCTSVTVYEMYTKLLSEFVVAVNEAHSDYKIETVTVVDYNHIE
jgi:hypothetical protein